MSFAAKIPSLYTTIGQVSEGSNLRYCRLCGGSKLCPSSTCLDSALFRLLALSWTVALSKMNRHVKRAWRLFARQQTRCSLHFLFASPRHIVIYTRRLKSCLLPRSLEVSSEPFLIIAWVFNKVLFSKYLLTDSNIL